MKKKILIFVGTRPEAIKLAPVLRAFAICQKNFVVKLVTTGQHREMLTQALADFGLTPDIALDVMREQQTLASLSSALFTSIDAVLECESPDMIIVQGDTTSVQVASLCAFYRHIPCSHVEAGLRSHDLRAPFPEELNRCITGMVASLHFAPTSRAAETLRLEGVAPNSIHVTGNTVIDALVWMAKLVQKAPPTLPAELETVMANRAQIVLVTGHRRENFGAGLRDICRAVNVLAAKFPQVVFLYPVHLNPLVQAGVKATLDERENIILTHPLTYREFIRVMCACHCILTDSGGIQEEAPALNKPVLVTRSVTERPEGIETGCARLVGTDSGKIIAGITELIENKDSYEVMARSLNPYGDGIASQRIVDAIAAWFTAQDSVCV